MNSTGSTTITCAAPAYRAPWIALLPTPPAPKITTVCPGRTPAAYTEVPQPVGTPQPVSAATSNGMYGSIGTQEFCETTARSAKVPSMQNPPRSAPSSSWNLKVPSASIPVIICAPQSHRFCRPVEQYRHVPQAGMNEHTTWSPAFTRVTSWSDGLDHPRALVAADHRQPPGAVAGLDVLVGVAQARRLEGDPHLALPGLVKREFGDLPRLARFPDDRCPGTHTYQCYTAGLTATRRSTHPNRDRSLWLTTNPCASTSGSGRLVW